MSVTELYRWYDSTGGLLYVGISNNAAFRATQHKYSSKWYSRAVMMRKKAYQTLAEAHKAEKLAIRTESPECNIQNNGVIDRSEVDEVFNHQLRLHAVNSIARYKNTSEKLSEDELTALALKHPRPHGATRETSLL